MNSSNSMFVSSKTIFRRNLPRDLKKWYFVRKRGKDWRMLWVRKIGRIRFTNRGYKSYSFVCILSIHSNNPLLWWSFRDYENHAKYTNCRPTNKDQNLYFIQFRLGKIFSEFISTRTLQRTKNLFFIANANYGQEMNSFFLCKRNEARTS